MLFGVATREIGQRGVGEHGANCEIAQKEYSFGFPGYLSTLIGQKMLNPGVNGSTGNSPTSLFIPLS